MQKWAEQQTDVSLKSVNNIFLKSDKSLNRHISPKKTYKQEAHGKMLTFISH